MKDLHQIIEETKERRRIDAERFKQLDRDSCQLCHAHGEDKRSLFISCLYAVHEVLPEAIDLFDVPMEGVSEGQHRGYYLNICKSCRAGLLSHLKAWRNECVAKRDEPMDHDGNIQPTDPDRNIPVRINGAIQMLTREEWDRRAADEAARKAVQS